MVMTYSHAKVQGQWRVGYEDRQMDGGDCITSLANTAGKHRKHNDVISAKLNGFT